MGFMGFYGWGPPQELGICNRRMGWTFGVRRRLWAGCFSPCSSSLAGSGLEALYGVIGVGQDVAVDGPEDTEEAKGLLAPQLSSQAHRSAGLQDTPIRGALGHEEAADEEAEVLVAGELHQRLWDGGSEHGMVWADLRAAPRQLT